MARSGQGRPAAAHRGPSQRQLRAGELIRRTLGEILARRELRDEELNRLTVTVTEVRVSPDLKQATCFVAPLGGMDADHTVALLKRSKGELRRELAREVTFKFLPDLSFASDRSFDNAGEVDRLLRSPEVQRDLGPRGQDQDPE